MNTIRIVLSVVVAFAALQVASAQTANTEVFESKSESMNKTIPAMVVLPDSYSKSPDRAYPVLYLLHGYGGNYTTWATKTKPDLQRIASRHDMIVVCPDGARSWYWDAPNDPSVRYETYVVNELVPQIDAKYRTLKSPAFRAITGFSMGGHGGLWLGFRHVDVFGACGSLSGGVDIRPFPESWSMKDSLGDYAQNKGNWDSHTVIEQIYRLNPRNLPAIAIDCGTGDFFYEVNEALHRKLLYSRIPHDYTVRPGVHNHPYWNNAIEYQMLFFSKFFDRNLAIANSKNNK